MVLVPPSSSPAPDEWQRERDRAFATGARRQYVAATTLARRGDDPAAPLDAGLAKGPRDLELPPWNKGRYGTAIGRAVHAVLQTVDLESGAGVDDAVAAQAAAEGVLGHEATLAALVRAALASASVRRACERPRWREMYVAVPAEGLVLEGYIDLLYREDAGLVVLDYKTDAVGDESTLLERIEKYRLQAAAYAVAVEGATGEPVVRCVLCFLDPAGAREVVIEGEELVAAVEAVRSLARAEREAPSPLPPAVLADA
jgi:hypothetical protein